MIDFWVVRSAPASARWTRGYVAPGFFSDHPDRFWTSDPLQAKRFKTEADAWAFTRKVGYGDPSWNWSVERVFRFECNDEDCPEFAEEDSPYCTKHGKEFEDYLIDQAEKAAFDRANEQPDYGLGGPEERSFI